MVLVAKVQHDWSCFSFTSFLKVSSWTWGGGGGGHFESAKSNNFCTIVRTVLQICCNKNIIFTFFFFFFFTSLKFASLHTPMQYGLVHNTYIYIFLSGKVSCELCFAMGRWFQMITVIFFFFSSPIRTFEHYYWNELT